MTKYFLFAALIGLGVCYGAATGLFISESLNLINPLMEAFPFLMWLPVAILAWAGVYIVTLDYKRQKD